MQNCRLTNRGGRILLRVFAFLAVFTTLTTFAQGPVVSNVRAAQRAGTRLVDIYYDVASTSNRLTVAVSVSTNGGADYFSGSTNFVGDVGSGVAPGTNRLVTWSSGVEWNSVLSTNVRFRVVADDLGPLESNWMVLIPGGSFVMGDSMDGVADAKPVTTANISPFYMEATPVTWGKWVGVYSYATNHGYVFVNPGAGKADQHPVQSVNWHDVVKWCNARSEQAGKLPVYYTDPGLTVVYRSGEVAPYANWNAKGYRLPTEAEWEKAARGGLAGRRFPWGNLISQTNANYKGYTAGYAYDLGPNGYNPVGNYPTVSPGTSPVGAFAANGYGLYDMAGNVWQWCWDWYGTPYAGGTDPRGASGGSNRVLRGGGWDCDAGYCRTAGRSRNDPAYGYDLSRGFRCAISPDPSTNGMVLIPGGTFTMGDTLDGLAIATPVTNVFLSPFYMDTTPVTWSQWLGVYSYATNHGYVFVNPGAGKGATHPVQTVNWYDVVKWCNARSEQAGKVPVYYTDAGLALVYRSGEVTPYANWSAKGYRLPTEAEWEKGARGGLVGQRFPWGNLITRTNANYFGDTASYAYDLGPNGYNPVGNYPTTSSGTTPVGAFAANGYGLYDMAGNVWQWCWDWYGTPYAGGTDPRGVSTSSYRVFRGGSWDYDAFYCRSAFRAYIGPTYSYNYGGFRSVLPPSQ